MALNSAPVLLGNVLEWYDFSLYGFFSDTLAEVFFPPSNSDHENLVLSFLVFGGAFLARPVGGLVLGHVGDKYGRKRALVCSLACMSVPTIAMGFLPTYERAGGWSTGLLVACRLMQGFSAGGQLPSSLVYFLEGKPGEHWGFYGSLVSFSTGLGGFLGNLTGAAIRTLQTDEELTSWGWRVGFFTGILVVPVAAFVHLYGEKVHPNEELYDGRRETSEGRGDSPSSARSTSDRSYPLKESLRRENLPALFGAFLVPMLGAAGLYVTFVWMAIYMAKIRQPPVQGAFWVNLLASLSKLIMVVLAGWSSDRYGRQRVMCAGAVGVGLAAPAMLWIISWGTTLEALLAQMGIGTLLALFSGPMKAWLAEQFPPRVRATSASLSYNMGVSVSAGLSPAAATALAERFGPVAAGAIYPFFSVLALIGMLLSNKFRSEGDESCDATQGSDDDLSTTLLNNSVL